MSFWKHLQSYLSMNESSWLLVWWPGRIFPKKKRKESRPLRRCELQRGSLRSPLVESVCLLPFHVQEEFLKIPWEPLGILCLMWMLCCISPTVMSWSVFIYSECPGSKPFFCNAMFDFHGPKKSFFFFFFKLYLLNIYLHFLIRCMSSLNTLQHQSPCYIHNNGLLPVAMEFCITLTLLTTVMLLIFS